VTIDESYFEFEALYDHFLDRDNNARRECSRLGRNIVNTKGKPNLNPNLTYR